ncbi:MAG: hypothetical protein JW726_12925 [Anaerolineales bacterium]|nr:hypothetical protein [Anaerolineales bacterium]
MNDSSPQYIYRIKIEGRINPEWSAWLNGLAISLDSEQPPVTLLSGMIVDQARLRGILNKLWDLNLGLISLERFEPYGGKS